MWLALSIAVAISAVMAIVRRGNIGRALACVVMVFAAHGAMQWRQLASPTVGEFAGEATARSDATARNGSLSIILEIDGENFRLVAHGQDRAAVRTIRLGDVVLIQATRFAYDQNRLRFSAGRHVQGELRDATIIGSRPSSQAWYRAANRVHDVINRGARTMQPHDAALTRGFLLGDESGHPRSMIEAFRGAGLGHLTAVSGQNVTLLLAALTPLLRRLSRWSRLATALGVISMFAVITRLESSVVRAAVMAGIVQIGFAIGRDATPLRALALTVIGVVAIDPLATWSVGFVLSVAATTGLVVITPLFGGSVFAATAAAQLAVAPFILLWFGTMPSIALVTNVLAGPVASVVMTLGPPVLAIAAVVPDAVAHVLTVPVVAAGRWVWWVAEWGTRLGPSGVSNALVWCVVLALLARRLTPVRGWQGADLSHHG